MNLAAPLPGLEPRAPATLGARMLALVGQPNVGKSAIFRRLTGARAEISNYPGTTVELNRADSSTLPGWTLVDTPGLVGLPSLSEDEDVTARVLLEEPLGGVIQVVDLTNLRRSLLLTTQLLEMGRPMVLALNMADEARSLDLVLDRSSLQAALGVQVVETQAVSGEGISELAAAVRSATSSEPCLRYEPEIETAIQRLVAILPPAPMAPRGMACLWLARDGVVEGWLRDRMTDDDVERLGQLRRELAITLGEEPTLALQRARLEFATRLAARTTRDDGRGRGAWQQWLSRISLHPVWGLGVLAAVVLGVFVFVGRFGAGFLVETIEGGLFEAHLTPWVAGWVHAWLGQGWWADLLVGPYGLWTMGITYAAALILPIVSTFFLAFGLLEDSGYLPRLSALSNRWFERIGLNGKAILPMVLGLGCVTMATMTTRILETRRERLMAILLLALAVPCSAQLGLVMGMLAGISLTATAIWAGVILAVLFLVGWLASKLMPGAPTPLLLDLPPFRMPDLRLVLVKTITRVEWYLREVVPLFLLGSALMFLLDRTHLLQALIQVAKPLVVDWLGLPAAASAALVLGFFRRDFGAAGLYALQAQGGMQPAQVVVAMVTVTLFIPCVASVLMIARERGWRTTAGLLAMIFPLAFAVGGGLHWVLSAVGWGG